MFLIVKGTVLVVKRSIYITQKWFVFLQLSSYGRATVTKHLDRDGLDHIFIKSPGIQSNTAS